MSANTPQERELYRLSEANMSLMQRNAEQGETITRLRAALTDLRDYFAYGQREHTGMSAVATPRCSPSVWKEIKKRVDAALAAAQETPA